MSEEKESSVLFNLRELMNLEEDRVRSEEEERLQREAAERERLAAEAKARQEEEAARLRADEEARQAEAKRIREVEELTVREREEAELRVRLEQEAREKAEAHARMLDHERELAAISAQQRKGVHPGLLAAAAVLVLGAGFGSYFGYYKPKIEHRDRFWLATFRFLVAVGRATQRVRKGLVHAVEIGAKRLDDWREARHRIVHACDAFSGRQVP